MQLPPHVRARFGGMNEHVKQMAHEAGMEIVTPEIIPNSRRALESSEYAREQGKHEEFHQVVFRKFYGEGQDLSSWAMLRAAAEEVGLDPDEMQRKTESGNYQGVVNRQITQAQAMGITGVPAYIFDNKYAIVGAQPYEVFQQAMARLMLEAEGAATD